MTKILRHLLLSLMALLTASGYLVATAQDPSAALKSEDYAALVRLYQAEVERSPAPTSTMYYNLGVSYLMMQRKADAIKHLEMALYLEPTHAAARHTLRDLYKEAPRGLGDPASPLSRLADPLCYTLSMGAWAAVALGLFALALAAVAFYFLAKTPRQRRIGFYSAATLLVCVLVANAAILHQRYWRAALEQSLTLRDITSVFALSEAESEVLATLPALSALPYTPSEGAWLEVRLGDGRTGWVRTADVVLPLMPPSP